MSTQQPAPCGTCHGTGGQVVDTSSSGITRQNWTRCDTCQGSGTQS